MNTVMKLACHTVGLWCVCIFVYGLVRFTDSPYVLCTDGVNYCGRSDRIHSPEHFAAFNQWKRAMFLSWPFGILAGVVISRMSKMK